MMCRKGQQVRFARAGIALHQQPRGEQLLEIDEDALSAGVPADVDLCAHPCGLGR